jgi:prevent-host-death family protein
MDSVTVAHAKAHLSAVLDKVAVGGPITITRRGKPVATLQAVTKSKTAIDLAQIDAVRKKLPHAKSLALDLVHAIRRERD